MIDSSVKCTTRVHKRCRWKATACVASKLIVLFMYSLSGNMANAQTADWETWADTVIEQVRQDFEMPSATILVTDSNGSLLSKGYGLASLETRAPMTPDTQLQVASVAKTMIFFALMQMIDQGKISLQSDVFESLDLPQPNDGFGRLRVSHLLTHTDGFADQTVGIVEHDRDKVWSQYALFSQQTPVRVATSGSRIAYSNYGTVAAKALIEKISTKDIGDYLINQFYIPMGMNNSLTGLSPDDPRIANMAVDYRNTKEGLIEVAQLNPKVTTLVTTTNDMGVFLRMILNDGKSGDVQVLSEEMIAKALSAQYRPDSAMPGVSYGLMEHRQNGLTGWRRDGHGTESRSRIMIYPDLDLAVYVYTGIDDNRARDAVSDALFERLGGGERQIPVLTHRCERSSGQYGPIQNDHGTYGKVQVWFAGLLQVDQTSDCTLKIAPVNFDAYGGLEGPSTWHLLNKNLYLREEPSHGELIFTGSDLHLGTGMMGSYRKLSFMQRPDVTLWTAIALCLSFALLLITGIVRFLRGHRGIEVWLLLLTPVIVAAYASLAAWGAFMWGGTLPAVPAYAYGPNILLQATFATAPLILVLFAAALLMAFKYRSAPYVLLALSSAVFLCLIHSWNWTIWNAGF